MKFLFVHQNFPGQYLHVLRRLAALRRHEILFVSEPNDNFLEGVRKISYRLHRLPSPDTHFDAREFEQAMIRAEAVALACKTFRDLGFVPDIIIGHHGWGELLNLRDLWPDVPMLGYFEFFYHTEGLDVDFDPEFPTDRKQLPSIRAKNAVNLLALSLDAHGQTPTQFQRETYPEWARRQITVLPEGADLQACRPDPACRDRMFVLGDVQVAPTEKLVTYVARGLEPYRGFHVLMRALPRLLRERTDARVIIVGSDEVSYGARPREGTWRERMTAELQGQYDESRVHLVGRVMYPDYLRLLQRSDAHVYLTYPFVASWSLREALAIGCAIIASDTDPVREFVTDGRTGLLVRFPDPDGLAEAVLRLLADAPLSRRLRAAARRYAERHLPMAHHIAAYEDLIRDLTGRSSGLKEEGEGALPPQPPPKAMPLETIP
ncbi:MAG: glycosyltransferase [Acidisphaera sp.]|nr:glycosyltransferase [Acidisphaera sp.]